MASLIVRNWKLFPVWIHMFCSVSTSIVVGDDSSGTVCPQNPIIRLVPSEGPEESASTSEYIFLESEDGRVSNISTSGQIKLNCTCSRPAVWDFQGFQAPQVRAISFEKYATTSENITCYTTTITLGTEGKGITTGRYICREGASFEPNYGNATSVNVYNRDTSLVVPEGPFRTISNSEIPCNTSVEPIDHYKCRYDSIIQSVQKPAKQLDTLEIRKNTTGDCTTFFCQSRSMSTDKLEIAYIPCKNVLHCKFMRKYAEMGVNFEKEWKRSDLSCKSKSVTGQPVVTKKTKCKNGCTSDANFEPNGIVVCRTKDDKSFSTITFNQPNLTEGLEGKPERWLETDYIKEQNPSDYMVGIVESEYRGYYVVGEEVTARCIASNFKYPQGSQWLIVYANGSVEKPSGEREIIPGKHVTVVEETFTLTRPNISALVCQGSRWDTTAPDNLTFSFPVKVASKPVIINATEPSLKVHADEKNVTIFCKFSCEACDGFEITKDGRLVERLTLTPNMVLTTFDKASTHEGEHRRDISGTYTCYGINPAGNASRLINITVEYEPVSSPFPLVPIIIIEVILILCALLFVLIVKPHSKLKHYCSRKNSIQNPTSTASSTEITTATRRVRKSDSETNIEVLQLGRDCPQTFGTNYANILSRNSERSIGPRYLDDVSTASTESLFVPNETIDLDGINSFSPKQITYDEKLVQLGEGNFGIVYKGYLDGHPVAVKCVKHGRKWLKALQSELKIFASLGCHQNVISLVGVVQQPLSFHADAMEIQIIIEFCGNGDLRSYLRKNRGRFCDLIQNDQVYSPCSITVPTGSSSPSSPYTHLAIMVTTVDLIEWAIQCAAGMDYLASQGIVHGDLALRNLLLTADKVLKVSDFGLSKKLQGRDYYVCKNPDSARLPWASTAPELFAKFKPSTSTDIWSYGVAMWEMFSLAQTPYRERFVDGNIEFVRAIVNGYRLAQPPYATTSMYQIMSSCWSLDSNRRPSFSELGNRFRRELPTGVEEIGGYDSSYGSATSPTSSGFEHSFHMEEEEPVGEWNPAYLLTSADVSEQQSCAGRSATCIEVLAEYI